MATIPSGRFTSESGYSMRQRLAGLKRAAYWRALGWPNLKMALEAKARYREQRKQEALKAKAQEQLRKAMESTGDF